MDEKIRKKILTLLDEHRIMTIATLRPDGWPQATTVGYVRSSRKLPPARRPGERRMELNGRNFLCILT